MRKFHTCKTCDGVGSVVYDELFARGFEQDEATVSVSCSDCHGLGEVDDETHEEQKEHSVEALRESVIEFARWQ